MNKAQFISKVCDRLHTTGARKEFAVPAHSIKVSDSDGNERVFKYKLENKTALYTISDVAAILDACLDTVVDAVRSGEPISIYGFGKLSVKRGTFGRHRDILNPEIWHEAKSYTYPSVTFGREVQAAARTYGLLEEQQKKAEVPPFEEEDV